VPWLWKKEQLYSNRLVEWHFWISTIGIVFYISAMWVSGIMQGLMWRATDQLGFLQYAFIETVAAMNPFYVIRATGGVLFVAGALLMVWNLWMTARRGLPETDTAASPRPAAAIAGA
jgi:cytochrome c oxidase cbb3-type subunit 1